VDSDDMEYTEDAIDNMILELNITMLWINTTQNAKSRICVACSRRNMYSTFAYANWYK
jgi:uncharacterized protein YaeQ